MAEIRDTLRLDIDQALRQVRELENALNRALSQIVVNLDTRQAVRSADRLNDELSEGQKFVNNSQDAMRRFTADLKRADSAAEKLDKEMRDVAQSSDKAADQTRRIGREAKKATGQFKDLGKAAKRGLSPKELGLTALAGFGIREVVRGLGSLVSAASEVEESINAVQVVFGEAADDILAFGRDTSDAVFLAAGEFNSLAVVTGNLLQGFNLDAQTAADLTIQLTNRASDMASVFDTEVAEALEAINSALRGETEQIRRFTGSFSINEVKAFGRELFGVTGELTAQQQALAAVELIMSKTALTTGDSANTMDSLAQRQRRLNELWGNAQVALGQGLLPVLSDLLEILIDITPALEDAAPGFADFIAGAVRGTRFIGNTVSSVVNLGQGIFDLTRLVTLDTRAFDQFGEAGRAGANAIRDVTGAVNEAIPDTAALAEAFLDSAAAAAVLSEDSLTDLSFRLPEVTDAAAALEDQFGQGVRDAYNAAADASDAANEEFRNTGFALAAAAEPAVRLVEELGFTEQAFADATEAVDNFREATLKLADPVFAAAEAQADLTDAITDLADLRKDPERTVEGLANAALEVARKTLEADAALRALGDINLSGSPIERSLDVFGVALGITREEVRQLLVDAGVLTETDIGVEVVFTVDTFALDDALSEIPASIDILAAFRVPSIPRSRFDDGPIPEGSSGGGVVLNINNPVDSDIAGGAAQAVNIVSTIPGLIPRVK